MKEDLAVNQKEGENKKKAKMSTGAILLLLFALAIFPFFTYPDPKPEQEGILVNLGMPDVGQGEENAPAATAPPTRPKSEPEPEKKPEPKPTPPKETKPEPPAEKKVVTTEDPEAIRIKQREAEKKKKADAAAQKQREEDARREAQAEAERQKRAAEEAKRQKAEAERNATKSRIGDLFSDGGGKGNTGKEGNQGDPNGDPDASRLEGISTGKGRVGGGLGGRGGSGPRLSDSSQKVGKVVVYVCVDSNGKVTSADYTQKGSYGSAASDSAIRRNAIANAKKWKFKSGAVDKQCGTISYEFKFN